MEQYLTSEQVAKILQVHPFTVLKYLKSGQIKGVKIGRVYRIRESDVEKFLGGAQANEAPAPKNPAPPAPPTQQKPAPKKPAPQKELHEIKFEDDEKEEAKEYYKMI